MLIAFEGIDRSGKATQAKRLADSIRGGLPGWSKRSRDVTELAFPDYGTASGAIIRAMLHGSENIDPRRFQLMCAANRFEKIGALDRAAAPGDAPTVICDRYNASAAAYGSANGLPALWLESLSEGLPRADVTVLIDVDAETAAMRGPDRRDGYERNIDLQKKVREAYARLARTLPGWIVIDGSKPRNVIADAVRRRMSDWTNIA